VSNESQFPIKITGDASSLVAASQQTNAALKSNKGELTDVKAGITDGVNPALANLSSKTVESAKAAEHAEVSHKAMRFGLRMLGPEAAEAGHALLVAFSNPATLAFIAVTLAMGKVLKDWEKTKEAIESAPDLSGINAAIRALGSEGLLKALVDGDVATEEFWRKINGLAAAQETLREKTDEATEAIRKQTDSDNKELSAKEKAELAELKLAKTRGQITEEEYEASKAKIEDHFENLRNNNKEIEQQEIIAARKKEREGQQSILDASPDVRVGKEIASDRAKGALATEKAGLEEWKKKLAEIDDWFKKDGSSAMGSSEGRQKYAEMEKARRLAWGEITNREEGTIPEAEKKSKAADRDLTQYDARVEAAQNRKNELDREISKLEADATRDSATRTEVGSAHKRERAAEAEERTTAGAFKTPGGKLIKDVAEAEGVLQQGGQITVSQRSEIAILAQKMQQAHVQQSDAIIRALGTVHGNTEALTKIVLDLEKKLEGQRHRITNAQNP
jgi:hypothetical protein